MTGSGLAGTDRCGWITVQSARVVFIELVTHGSDSRVRADAWLSCFSRQLPRLCMKTGARGSSAEQSAVSLLLTDYCWCDNGHVPCVPHLDDTAHALCTSEGSTSRDEYPSMSAQPTGNVTRIIDTQLDYTDWYRLVQIPGPIYFYTRALSCPVSALV